MSKPKVALAVFATTKGHYDHKDIYKATINDLEAQDLLSFFEEKIVHVKREEGDDLIFSDMEKFFKEKNFYILSTFGEWKHYNVTHYIEHAKDIITLMTNPVVQSCQYVFWLEDDFLIRSYCNLKVRELFEQSIKVLDSNPNLLNVRFLKNEGDLQGLNVTNDSMLYNQSIFTHTDVYSFNPSFARTRDVWIMAKIFKDFYFQNLNIHIERFATDAIKQVSMSEQCFSAYLLNVAKAVHIGEKDFSQEFLNKYKL